MITFERVDKWFGPQPVLQQVSFTIHPGEIVGLCGVSGSGKTTILRLIAGLEHPDAGRIGVNENARISYMFQEPRLLPWQTALGNIAVAVRAAQLPDANLTARYWLDHMGLLPFANHYPAQLSGGMQQRVALARALAIQPDILLLDEPFSNVDRACKTRLITTLRDTAKQQAITVVYVTHELAELRGLTSRIIYSDPEWT